MTSTALVPFDKGYAVVTPVDIDPATTMLEIERHTVEIDNAGRELGRVITELGEVELRYGDAFEDAVAQLIEDYDGKRVPGEEARRALIHKENASIRALFHEVRRLERRREALTAWSKNVERALSGRQTIMKGLQAEQYGPESQRSGQTYGARRA